MVDILRVYPASKVYQLRIYAVRLRKTTTGTTSNPAAFHARITSDKTKKTPEKEIIDMALDI